VFLSEPYPELDVVIPTCSRPASLAVTLAGVCSQTYTGFGVIVSDQTEDYDSLASAEVKALLRVLKSRCKDVITCRHLPRRGMAEHRQFLLDQVRAPYVLYLDDDLLLENDMFERLMRMILEQRCGFVGAAPIGLSYIGDVRLNQQEIEFWEEGVKPEDIRPHSPEWERHLLHNAANVFHVQNNLRLTPRCQRPYKIAWVGGCVLYDVRKLRKSGGYTFWRRLPGVHCGEDVLAQLSVMRRYGGCGVIPSGVFHLELTTTLPDRSVNAPEFLSDGFSDEKPGRNHGRIV